MYGRCAEYALSREAEKQRSREAEKQRSREAEKQRSREFCRSRRVVSSALLHNCRQAAAPMRKAEEYCIMRSLIAFSIGHTIRIDKQCSKSVRKERSAPSVPDRFSTTRSFRESSASKSVYRYIPNRRRRECRMQGASLLRRRFLQGAAARTMPSYRLRLSGSWQ